MCVCVYPLMCVRDIDQVKNKYVHGYIDNYKCMFLLLQIRLYNFPPLKHSVVGFV